MSDAPTPAHTLRIGAADVLARLRAGEPVRFLDARSDKAWRAAGEQVRGAVRVRPLLLSVDPSWDPTHLTVIY